MFKTLTAAAFAGALLVTGSAHANLLGDQVLITVSHTGVAGDLAGPALINHTYGGLPSLHTNQFFGSFVVASPMVAPGYDNAILVDFTLFNYSGFLAGTGTITISGLAENVAPGSIAIIPGTTGMGANIASGALSGPGMLTASWSPGSVYTLDPQASDAMIVAWDSAPVPAPGALALLGVAGVVSARRRRR